MNWAGQKLKIIIVTAAAVLLYIAGFIQPSPLSQNGKERIIKHFHKTLHSKEKFAKEKLDELRDRFLENERNLQYRFAEISERQDISFFIFREDSLIFWSDNLTEVPPVKPPRAVRLNNSWYESIINKQSQFTFLALIRINIQYPYSNQYLKAGSAENFDLPPGMMIGDKGEHLVTTADSETLFRITFPSEAESRKKIPWFLASSLFLFLSGQFLLLTNKTITEKRKKISILLLSLPAVIALLFKVPLAEFNAGIFNPAVYSSSFFFPSLGILILKSFIAMGIVVLLLSLFTGRKGYLPLCLSLISVLIVFLSWVVPSFIRDSSIPLELSGLLSLNGYSFTALLFIIALILLVIYLLKEVITYGWKFSTHGLILLLAPVALSAFISSGHAAFAAGISVSVIISAYALIRRERFLIPDLLAILFLTVPVAFILEEEVEEKHFGILRSEAESLASARDPVLEFLFDDLRGKIESDEVLQESVLNREKSQEDILLLLRHRYLKGYWNKFDISLSSYDTICNVIHQWGTQDRLPLFEQIINEEGQMVDDGLFYYQDIQRGRSFYLGKIELAVKGSLCGVMYLEFTPLYFPEQPGYPELLMNKKGEQKLNFSWARYEQNRLMTSSGRAAFPLSYSTDTIAKDVISKKNDQYVYALETPGQLVITTIPEEGPLQKSAVFSFLFMLGLTVYFAGLPLFNLPLPLFRKQSLRSRLYLSFFLLTFGGLGLAAFTSYYFIKRQDELKNRELIGDKMKTALAGLLDVTENLLKLDPVLNPFLDIRIDEISNDLRTDINLYDLKGNLLSASSPAIFNEKLLSRKMEPRAFQNLSSSSASSYIQEERLGNLHYLSGYIPLTTPSGKILGFLNLPYFAAEKELQEDISSVVQALLSIYMLLFLAAMLLAGFISSRLSGPLKLLQDRLSAINLLGENRQLSWKHDDEIGALIRQYNSMVVKLSDSAERLALSERENAWKEMAKQVAHEIKNPLTPMKLSVQHLQKAVSEKAPDLDRRIERFTANLIEQIETLSRIASEFSDFARLPEAQKEVIDLRIFVPGIVETFRNDSEYDLSFEPDAAYSEIRADRAQLIRVFNNLLKNSIQSFRDGERGRITIALKQERGQIKISISDNGRGIGPEIATHIFTPKFTTKSGGMGLGLSMVKSIIENHGGTISFTSAEGEGTTFDILLPPAK